MTKATYTLWGDHMRDYMDRRVTPPKWVTSPTWRPPPPCKQALHSSMLRHGLRLICIKSYNAYNFVKIYQNLPKFGNLGQIGNLNFPVA